MRGRFLFLLLAPLAAGCPGRSDNPGSSGELILQQVAADTVTLVSAPTRARWCATDSTLSILAIGSSWSAVIGIKTPWPPLRLFSVDSMPAGVGIGTIAARLISDSIGVAIVSRTGTIEVDSGLPLAGRFNFESGRDSTLAAFVGRFEGLRPDTAACALP